MSVTSSQSYSTTSRLLMKARSNDPDAWERLSLMYGPLVYRWARRAGLQPQDATDLVQEVFKSVLISFDSFHHDSFRAWLWIITRNHLYNWFRKRPPEESSVGNADVVAHSEALEDLMDSDCDPDEENSKALLLQRGLELIKGDFEESTWQAFWLLAVEKRPVVEISEQTGMNAGAIRQAKYRVLLRLRDEFGRL